MTTEIHITSPAGSGNTFCEVVLENFTEADYFVDDHSINGLYPNKNHIFILREPLACIASAVERHFDENEIWIPREFIHSIEEREKIEYYVDLLATRYKEFINYQQDNEKIFRCTFEYLTTQTDDFINSVAKHFNIERRTRVLDVELLMNKMRNKDLGNRLPRDKTINREIINKYVMGYPEMKKINKLYIEYKQILQSTEI